MKRRAFLTGVPLLALALPALATGVESTVPAFVKAGALRFNGYDADLTEVAFEDAIVRLVSDVGRIPTAFALVVPEIGSIFTSARVLIAELDRLRAQVPLVPRIELRFDRTMRDENEWGLVASDGRCFWSSGA